MVVGTSGQRPEVVEAPPGAFDARWSPDGRSIAIAAPKSPSSRDRDIWVVSANGTHARDIADAGPDDWWPSWSPDGTKIAFTDGYGASADVYLVNVDGRASFG
jgi:Tol biopolymer transport system component